MRTQIAMLEDYRNCDVGPETALWNVRPYGREVIWKEDGRATIWHTFILEENYNPDTFDLEKLEGERIPEEYYRLPYDPAWTEVKGPLQHDQFLKVVEPTGYSAAETERTWPASEVNPIPGYGECIAGHCDVTFDVITAQRGNSDS